MTTTSGTAALQLAIAALGIGPGDEVILPALTIVSTAFAVCYAGATPVLVDSEPELVCSSRRQSDPVVAHYLAALHHPVQRAQGGHVFGRVAVQRDQIGVLAGLDAADVVVGP